MAELKINENEVIKGSVDEIIDFLNKRSKNENRTLVYRQGEKIDNYVHGYVIEKDTNIKKAITTILEYFKLDNITDKRIVVLNEGSNEKIAYKLIKELMDCIRYPELF